MKYTKEQLKDLILLAKEGCFGRICEKCMWRGNEIFCKILINDIVISGTEMATILVKYSAKERIKEILEL